ncbi:uncharacterized protein B0J16DRAFT_323763 [Fusarium flagelliforme]|uniref:uncharacterized protein n=1 Tax=Fusarium flagelliforme TaxID=2675880 RepID=UPI001E8DE7C6|nr:uncharacterized protein B0J16DRAFT_323763 [Fusarium flagelliforme]KAH7174301.1 hypothetical protein B0J16DRAFT_323763 [Fusarium flagelliforme]
MPEDLVASTEQMSSQPDVVENRFWTTDSDCLDIDLDFDDDTERLLEDFAKADLWHKTQLRQIKASHNNSDALDVENVLLNEKMVTKLEASEHHSNTCFEFFDVAEQKKLSPKQYMQLRISPRALRHLTSTYKTPLAFISAISRPFEVCGTVFRGQSNHAWDYWCQIPVRIASTCKLSVSEHAKSTAGSNQMDPFNYLHLDGVGRDVRPSTIGLHIQRDNVTGLLRVVCFSLLEPRSRSKVEPCLRQLEESLRRRSREDLQKSPCFVLLLFIAHALRWWNSTLLYFNSELIRHEKKLQEEIAKETQGFIDTSKGLNVALHTMAAHLHRYKTELNRIGLILSDLRTHRQDMTYIPQPTEDKTVEHDHMSTVDREAQRIEQLASLLTAISTFSDEMEKKP